MEGSDLFYDQSTGGGGSPPPPASYSRDAESVWAAGDRITWISGSILALSSFMGWYTGSGLGIQLSVIGWHTGVLGKLVFFVGLAVVAIVALRAAGFDLPLPESLVVLSLGAVGTVFVLLRVLSVPDSVLPADSRGIGLWIALAAALGVIAGGLLRAAEDL